MADLGPWLITARSKAHAEYLVRSRAEQRGLHVERLEATGGENDMWQVTATVTEDETAGQAAQLGDDTQVLHFETHRFPGR